MTTKTMDQASARKQPELERLCALVGTWDTEGTHPALPGVIVRGSVTVEWLEGQRFLIHRAQVDHPDFPDAVSLIGFTDQDRVAEGQRSPPATAPQHLALHYYDSRGVFRAYQASIDGEAWRFWREVPGFSQRFTGTFTDGGDVIVGVTQLRPDDVNWKDDLRITYRRRR